MKCLWISEADCSLTKMNTLRMLNVEKREQQDAVLSQGGPRDAGVNFCTYRSLHLQRHRVVFIAIKMIELNNSFRIK